MNMRITNVFSTLYHWKIRILAVIIIAVFLSGFYVDRIQTNSAQTIVKFNDASVSNGSFPDGKKFNVNEITSPKVVQRALDKLKSTKTVDNVRSRLTITPIIPTSVTEIKKSKEKEGEEYEYFPNTFTVVYSGYVNQSGSEARDVLDAVMYEYIKYYSEKYSSFVSVNNEVGDEDIYTYDYVEQADIISDNVDNILSSLEGYNSADNSFRSTQTGMSFGDLISEYNHLKNFTISNLYAEIFKGKTSENKEVIINKYLQREVDMALKQKNYQDSAEMIKVRMEAFSNSNKNVPNAYNYSSKENNDDIAMIEDLHKNQQNPSTVKTTYDDLMNEYTKQLVAADNSRLKAEHYRETAEQFKGDGPADVDGEEVKSRVENMLQYTIDEMNEMYNKTKTTIDDYNDRIASKNISLLTGVKCYENTSKSLYMVIAVILSAGFMVVLAIGFEFMSAYKKETYLENDLTVDDEDSNEDGEDNNENGEDSGEDA